SDPPVTLFVDLGNNASSTHFGDVNDALTRLALDDAHHRCKYLDVTLPPTDVTLPSTDDNTLPVPGVDNDPVSLTLPQVQTLVWRSDQRDIPMMYPATLTHLTNLTLRTTITFRDCYYILGCIQSTVRHFDASDLCESALNVLPNPDPRDRKSVPKLRKLESFSVSATSSPNRFLNHLHFDGVTLKTLSIEVHNDLVNPAAMTSIPWGCIKDISFKCDFVDGGANWLNSKASQAARLRLEPLVTDASGSGSH
ncbi:hypothetical protein H0H93_012694, partial [Arthromyces matolae]